MTRDRANDRLPLFWALVALISLVALVGGCATHQAPLMGIELPNKPSLQDLRHRQKHIRLDLRVDLMPSLRRVAKAELRALDLRLKQGW
jgi:hypothetical protein